MTVCKHKHRVIAYENCEKRKKGCPLCEVLEEIKKLKQNLNDKEEKLLNCEAIIKEKDNYIEELESINTDYENTFDQYHKLLDLIKSKGYHELLI